MVLSLLSPSPFTTSCVYLSLLVPFRGPNVKPCSGTDISRVSKVRVETVDINCVIKIVAHQ